MDQNRLKELVHYDSETGVFTSLVDRGKIKEGDELGCRIPSGYEVFWLDDVLYRAHRLAWLYVHGTWPVNQIDHEDRIKHHNWISNLRDFTNLENAGNRAWMYRENETGFPGVTRNKARFQARIKHDGVRYNLGTYKTPEEASDIRELAFLKIKNNDFEIKNFLENIQVE